MSTTSLESHETKDMRTESGVRNPAYMMVRAWLTELSDVVHQSVAATNGIWIGLASCCFSENLSFPKKLVECESIFGIVRTYMSNYRTMLEQYEGAFGQLQQQVNLILASEIPRVGLLPVRGTPSSQHEQTARSPDGAGRGFFS